jgi:hypothetical protein
MTSLAVGTAPKPEPGGVCRVNRSNLLSQLSKIFSLEKKKPGRSISGWIPSFKMGAVSPVRQPLMQLTKIAITYASSINKSILTDDFTYIAV